MLLRPRRVPGDIFSYNPDTKTLLAEISDFGPGFGFERVYDDACDVGLTIISHKTGREVVFAMDETEYDQEGDIVAWHLVPAQYQKKPDCTVTIFND